MNILIVEDQKEKSDDLISFFLNYNDGIKIILSKSLRSGLRALFGKENIDLVVLDMSMPNFDPSPDDPVGGTPESFAGREFLAQMDLRDIDVPVVVVTQYATFARGKIELEELDAFFKMSYSGFYLGSVFYSSADESWKVHLKDILKEKF